MRRTIRITAAVMAVLFLCGTAAYALISTQPRSDHDGPSTQRVAIDAAGQNVSIESSKGGSAILVAKGMTPGQTRSGKVSIRNTGKVPVTLSMGASSVTADPPAASSIFHTALSETGHEGSPFYKGTVAGFKGARVGDISPGQSREYTLQAILPASAGNEAENIATTFNIDWTAKEKTDGPPPPECKIRRMRARFFVFRKRPVIRMVSRYQATSGGKVKTTYYWRVKQGGKFMRGKRIGSTLSSFRRTAPGQWRLNRVPVRVRNARQMEAYRSARYGFYATLQPLKTKGYCANYLGVDLVVLKRKYGHGQYTWFQRGSFKFRPAP
ncbi:MAG: hypothetical protein J0H98_10760 [Solirubrobacterales bacterium]|nr:hypothetical protein [Solirubrobacterales bacterium]